MIYARHLQKFGCPLIDNEAHSRASQKMARFVFASTRQNSQRTYAEVPIDQILAISDNKN